MLDLIMEKAEHQEMRYLANVSIPKEQNINLCWEWTGTKDRKGYGKIYFDGKPQRAHRVAWQTVHGEIPDNLLVCHKCDNPGCVNPHHLFLGTNKDNTQDMLKKGRQRKPAAFYATAGQ